MIARRARRNRTARSGRRGQPRLGVPVDSTGNPVLRHPIRNEIRMLDAPVAAPEAEAQIARMAEKQLRMIALGVPHWRSG
jgi:hypothetical protein